ncbi:glutathione S-transferase 1 isoform X3 [Parasteatoda tepidariorum]|uniref:glutathione S-transferase 1 isoform X3 n=1 Tax=Parasteatoda tepidariorum TaxID=114398 RepID=UPI001C72404F|nr:glutathione S-transferase 1 isoform X3 [Parasteatoda tepidariorum]
MPVDVYIFPVSGPCRAVLMTAKMIGLDVNKKILNLAGGDQLKPEYIKMNPQHTVPTIDDNGFYLWESRAVCTYLVNKYSPDSPLYPKDPKERALVDRLLYFDIGTLYKAELEYMYPILFLGKAGDPEKKEAYEKTVAFLEEFLSKTPYVAGDHLTVADLSILASLTFAELDDFSYAAYPKITAWLNKMKSEVPDFKEINEIPLNEFREALKSRK